MNNFLNDKNYMNRAYLSMLFLAIIYAINVASMDISHGVITTGLLFIQAVLIPRRLMSNLYLVLFPLVVSLYMIGSEGLLDLYHLIPWFDKIVHFSMEFVLTLLAGSLLLKRYGFFKLHQHLFLVTIISFGITLGTAWEIIEWFITIFIPPTFDYTVLDTIGDLIIDSYGVCIAALLHLFWLRKSKNLANL